MGQRDGALGQSNVNDQGEEEAAGKEVERSNQEGGWESGRRRVPDYK